MQLTKGHMTLRQLPPPSPPYRRVAVFTLGLIGTCLLLALYAFDARGAFGNFYASRNRS